MTDADLTPFLDTYRELRGVLLHRRLDADDEQRQETAYFHALRRYPLRDIRIAADAILRTAKSFPAPAEWITALPRREGTADLRQLRESEAAEYVRASRQGWEDEPCSCVACQAADVTHRLVRFVPNVDERTGEVDQAVDANGHVVTPGHWAHGWELQRWYAARDRFLEQLQATFGRTVKLSALAQSLAAAHEV